MISSSQNTHLKRWRRLLESQGIDQLGQFLVSGERLVRETLCAHSHRCLELILPPKGEEFPAFPPDLRLYQLNQKLFDQLDIFGTRFPLLVCRAPDFSVANLASPPDGLEVLCPLGDPANVGAVIRTAVAMGVSNIIVLEESAHPLHPKSVRSASGAIFSATFCSGPSIREVSSGVSVVGLDLHGEDLPTFGWPKHIRVLVGEEGKGLGHLGLRRTLTIPISSSINSLNAAMAVGMALYAYRLQHPLNSGTVLS